MDRPRAATPQRRWLAGVWLSLAAAALYGVLAPAAKGALAHVEPVRAAGLTYLTAGCVALAAFAFRAMVGGKSSGGRIACRHAPRLFAMTLMGGVLGPVMFFAGLRRLAAHHAAVLQHLATEGRPASR